MNAVVKPPAPLVIAHRGASACRLENTLPAFELAVEQRADMIELDLHQSLDFALVVHHDAHCPGLSGSGEIGDARHVELPLLSDPHTGAAARIPLLDDVLERFAGRIPLNLELKRPRQGRYQGFEARVLDAVQRRGALPQTLFSSFHDAELQALRALSADANLALLISERSAERWRVRASALGAVALNPEAALVDAELLRAAHGEGLRVCVFTVDAPDTMHRLLDYGVDGLFTNHPDRLRALLDTRRRTEP